MNSNSEINNPLHFNKLNDKEKSILCKWIKDKLKPSDNINKKYTSYSLKHLFEISENGFYISNGQFKGAMLQCGHEIDKEELNKINCCFRFKFKE